MTNQKSGYIQNGGREDFQISSNQELRSKFRKITEMWLFSKWRKRLDMGWLL